LTVPLSQEGNNELRSLRYRDRILVCLLDGDLHFTPLKDKVGCSRGVLATHLRELRHNHLVEWGVHDPSYNYCCPSHLTDEGKLEAEKLGYIKSISSLPPDIVKEFKTKYKRLIVEDTFDYIQSFTIKKNLKIDFLLRLKACVMGVDAIERLLINNKFTNEEIEKLWLINGGVNIKWLLVSSESPEFFQALPFTISQEEMANMKATLFRRTSYNCANPLLLIERIKDKLRNPISPKLERILSKSSK
jgi:hypothetical protein